ncbi:unnamed protein product [Ceratitis capitata]|uniref:(Mediterranean fruit fly) hypothetical protein n=1 Tax=Ceratitis capitata TaxID=7213 RepID=A0A811UN41_CERCA|nr:unnamed protein product [Ceratitis capitata]
MTAATTATRTTSGKVRTTLTKSVPATPVQPKSPTTHFISTSPECGGVGGLTTPAATATGEEDDNDEQEEHYNNCSEYLPHSYPNFTFDLSDDDSNEFDEELDWTTLRWR